MHVTNTVQEGADLPHLSTLKIEGVFPYDAGYYHCHYKNSTNDKESVASVYLFVNGQEQTFLHHHLSPELPHPVGKTLHIDCAVTNRNYNVTLKINGRDVTKEDRVKYDPREGFSIENVTMEDEGLYVCESGEKMQGVRITISNVTKQSLPFPSIDKGKNQHFVKGQKFSLTCTVLDRSLNFTWTYPNTRVTHNWTSSTTKKGNVVYYNNILKVLNASESDTGRYTCSISSKGFLPSSASVNITVLESMDSFLNIISADTIKAHEGQKDAFKWKTTVQSYPTLPDIRYTNWRGQVLNKTEKIDIDYDEPQGLSWLYIKNISSSDFGNYSITVTVTDKEIEKSASATVRLEVSSPPHMKMTGVGDLEYVSEGQEFNVTCQAQGFPDVDVTLLFQNCSSTKLSSCSSPTTIETEEINVLAPGNIFEKSAVFSPNTSGYLQCHGENKNGSHNESFLLKMSDIAGIFVLRYYGADGKFKDINHEETITVVKNDNFTLMCGGAKYDYKMVEVNSSQPTGSNIQFQSNDSEFSWRKEKEVRKATESLTGRYDCYAHPHEDKSPDVKSFNIAVVPEERVVFEEETNMKDQIEVVKDDEPFSLKCLVRGSPQPTIRWLKDNKELTNESGLFDEKAMKFSSNYMELNFSHVGTKHTGVYTCIANNRLNEVRGSLTLQKAPPGLNQTGRLILAISVVGLAIFGIIIGFLIHRVRKEQEINNPYRMRAKEFFENGNVGSLNLTSTADKQAEMLPYDKKKWEVPLANITFGRQLGSGAFGRVIKATVTGLQGPATTTVAIKTCKNDVDAAQKAIISELKIMMHLGAHLNIVNLLGANTEHLLGGEMLILVEYCRFGNLLEFMQKRRQHFTNLISPVTGKIDPNLIPNSPTSPSFSESVPPSLDQDGYLAPAAKPFVLSDPPEGHSAGTVPSSNSSTSQVAAGQFASNPMYSMNIKPATEYPRKESRGSEDHRSSVFFKRKVSRLNSIGSITFSDGSSVSYPLRNRRTSQQFCHSALSPTDTCFMGGNDLDILYEIGSVPGITAPFSTIDLICWGWQMAEGMNYLSRRKILHGDLAARNLLLSDNNVLKISDFGLSRSMYRNDNYVKKGDDLLPIKWMSLEAIRDKIFSIESDVWAFGITLWEIFSLGCSPYAGVEVCSDFLEKLENGHRMSCPKYGNEEIYNIMKLCWEEDPLKRPSFIELVDDLGNMISEHTERYLTQNEAYMKMNSERFKEETDYLSMMAEPTFESRMRPDDIDVEHCLPMRDSTRNDSIRTDFPDSVVYINTRNAQASSTASPIESNYLPMNATKPQSPSDDVFTPDSSHPSRFTFPSSNPESPGLSSLLEEEGSTSEPKEELLETSALLGTSKQTPSDENLSNESKNELPTEENNSIQNYVNL
ncbi:vascular endothelial growth factor receptor 1-like isoform X2 [Portunus trituberculatus]|nr:vascular endothelial growth factor receptor 1-like isoform X2 [Portunus trituberculatus]